MDDAHDQDELQLQPLTTVSKPRPKALWAALAVVALAAGAIAVTALGDDGGSDASGQPLPISLLNQGGRAESAGATADMSLAWIQYEAGPDLPALGGTAPAYRLGSATEAQIRHLVDELGLEGDLNHDAYGNWAIQDGARMLNVTESGGAWWFNAAAVAVGRGTASGGSGSCGPGADCAVADCAPDVECQPMTTTTYDACMAPNTDCASPPVPTPGPTECDTADGVCEGHAVSPTVPTPDGPLPPDSAPCAKVVSEECGTAPDPDLPSKDDARAAGLAFLERVGTDTSGAIVTVDGGVSIWVVSVERQLDGRPSGLVSQALVGPKGEIQGGSGYLAEVEKLGDYPVLTTQATIDRANRMMASPMGDIAVDTAARDAVGKPAPAVAADDPAPTTTTVTGCKAQPTGIEICEGSGTSAGSSGTTGSIEPGVDPGTGVVPPPTVPPTTVPPEPATVTLVDAVPTLTLIGATDRSLDLYLVPAYRFTPEGGGQVDLISVSDDSLAGTPSTETTVPGSDGKVEPPVTTPDDCQTLVEGDDTGTTHTIQPCAPEIVPLEEG